MASAYSAAQLARYLDLIELPGKYRPAAGHPPDAALLHALHVFHLAAVPYENLSLHYSQSRTVALDPQVIYGKIVDGGRGRGGYCMENCILYHHVLRALGFDAYLTGGRIRLREDGVPHGGFMGWYVSQVVHSRLTGRMHIVNIVTLADTKYMVDVSFGGDGATAPMPLVADRPQTNLGTQEIRLVWESLPGQVSATKSWIYQYRNSVDKPWNAYYAFNEVEWLPQDFAIPNFYLHTAADSFQRRWMLVVKFLREDEHIVGKRMLGGHTVKENTGGRTQLLLACQSESERVQALRDRFGIILTDEESAAIAGYETQIRS